MTEYLGLEDVLRQVDRLGFVVRDPGLLAAALARPRASAFDADAYDTVWLKAAAFLQSIDANPTLVDGNKRLAWTTTKVFLRLTGQRLVASAEEGEAFMLGMVAAGWPLNELATWLHEHCTVETPPDLQHQAP